MTISYGDLSDVEALVALHDAALIVREAGAAMRRAGLDELGSRLTEEEAEYLLHGPHPSPRIAALGGRLLNVDLSKSGVLEPREYDLANGAGGAEQAIGAPFMSGVSEAVQEAAEPTEPVDVVKVSFSNWKPVKNDPQAVVVEATGKVEGGVNNGTVIERVGFIRASFPAGSWLVTFANSGLKGRLEDAVSQAIAELTRDKVFRLELEAFLQGEMTAVDLDGWTGEYVRPGISFERLGQRSGRYEHQPEHDSPFPNRRLIDVLLEVQQAGPGWVRGGISDGWIAGLVRFWSDHDPRLRNSNWYYQDSDALNEYSPYDWIENRENMTVLLQYLAATVLAPD